MNKENNFDFETIVFKVVDEVKSLLSPEKWNSELLDCSKNEVLALFYIYRMKSTNMGSIAEYINAPLNTLTGVIVRLERKNLILRQRDTQDKRVIKITLTEKGKNLFDNFLEEVKHYFTDIYDELSNEEKSALITIVIKAFSILKRSNEEKNKEEKEFKKVRRIKIE